MKASRGLRVLFLTERYPPHRLGGYEIACEAVAEGLRHRGHEIVVVTSSFGEPGPVRQGHVHRVLHRPLSPSLSTLGFWELHDLAALRSYRAFHPQVVYVWGISQLFASLWRVLREQNWPVVHNVQDTHVIRQIEHSQERWALWTKPGASPLRGLIKSVLRRALLARDPAALRPLRLDEASLNHLVFPSSFIRDHHAASGLPLVDHRLIYNAVDRRIFHPPSHPRPERPLSLLFVGRLHEEKGLHVALDAVEHMLKAGHDLRLDIYAIPAHPSEYGEALRRRVSERLAGAVRFLEPVNNEELGDVYRIHDALLFPSSRLEGLPMVLAESMACALPAISTTSGGSAELVRDGVTAIAIPPNDVRALVEAIERVIADRSLLRRLSETAAELAREMCDLDTVLDRTEAYLNEINALAVTAKP